jgi:hypothetical protein
VPFTKARRQDKDTFLHSLGQRLAGEFNGNPEAAK